MAEIGAREVAVVSVWNVKALSSGVVSGFVPSTREGPGVCPGAFGCGRCAVGWWGGGGEGSGEAVDSTGRIRLRLAFALGIGFIVSCHDHASCWFSQKFTC